MLGGFSLSFPSVLLYIFIMIILDMFWLFVFVFSSLVGFLPPCPFPVFCFVSISLLPLLVLFLCLLLLFPLVLSEPLLRLLCSLFFLRLFFSSPFSSSPLFPSPSSSFLFPFFFFFLLWPLFLGFFLGFLFHFSSSCLSVASSMVPPPPLFLSPSFVSVSFPLPSPSLRAGYSSFSSVLAVSLLSSSSSSLSS